MKYKIITLCGSLKFIEDFVALQIKLERFGHVVLSVTAGEEALPPTEEEKKILDKVHFKKIALSDCIIVLNIGGYIGQSTASEIQYAQITNKPVHCITDPDFKEVFFPKL